MIAIESDGSGQLILKGEATIHHAETMREKLVGLLEEEQEDWIVDMSELAALDTAGLQILLSFKKSTPSVKFHSCPVVYREMIEQLGLAHELF